MSGILYLVATPIGNLDDITFRAINILKSVDLIAAEDTRHTLQLLNHFEIKKPLISYYKETEKIKAEVLINKLNEGKDIALVSDAGTPAISDPGEEVVKEAIKNGIKIVPIPGACALVNALIASGLNTREFIFLGFLSTNNKEKKEKIEEIKNENKTLIFYEAPHKIDNTLKILYQILGNRRVVLAREITKIHEEFIRGNLEELVEKEQNNKGEYVIIVEGTEKINAEKIFLNNLTLEEHYKYYEKQNLDIEFKKRIRNSTSKNNCDERLNGIIKTGKILHLDGDKKYAGKSEMYYKKMGLNAIVKNIPENKQSKMVKQLLMIYNPDILVITGHDGMIKNNAVNDIFNYRNSRHFIETIKQARKFEKVSKKKLVIFAGACQSYFEALISAGANFASSPARILIDFLDPLIVAKNVAETDNMKYVTIDDFASELRDGKNGVDGIGARGKKSIIII